jgi:hypothetical protein
MHDSMLKLDYLVSCTLYDYMAAVTLATEKR